MARRVGDVKEFGFRAIPTDESPSSQPELLQIDEEDSPAPSRSEQPGSHTQTPAESRYELDTFRPPSHSMNASRVSFAN